jgi:hypothetical protein
LQIVFLQVGYPEMVKSLKETDLPEPWFGNKSKGTPAPKGARVTSELMSEQHALEVEVAVTSMKKGKGRGKGKQRENPTVKGKNNLKYDRGGPANVVLGRPKNQVADPNELRRKRVEDAAACGRLVKTIPHPGKRRGCTPIADTESSDQKSEDGLAPVEKGVGSVSPAAVETQHLSGSKIVKCPVEHWNAVRNELKLGDVDDDIFIIMTIF